MSARKRLGLLALALGMATAHPGLAQAPAASPSAAASGEPRPDPNDPDSVLVEELVVTARDKGPAWWVVTNGQSTVYVLGAPSLAPKRLAWDRSVFDRRLKGANEVILPFQDVKVRALGIFGIGFKIMRLRSSTPFEDTLSPEERTRFVAARTKLDQPAKRYGTKNPLAAGVLMVGDYRKHERLTTSDPAEPIKVYAEMAKVPVVQKTYDAGPLLGAVLRTPDSAGRTCLDEAIEQVEAGPGITLQAAKAWADGDVRGALANERTYERCMALVPGAAAFDARTKADEVSAIEDALKKPGHSIAVVPLRPLLSQGGVLDRLRSAGYQIRTPDED